MEPVSGKERGKNRIQIKLWDLNFVDGDLFRLFFHQGKKLFKKTGLIVFIPALFDKGIKNIFFSLSSKI